MSKDRAISPSDRLYSSRIIATYIKFLRKQYDHVDINDVLSYAGMETYQVEDEAYWFTQEQVDRFNERVVKVTGKSDIAREAGRFGFSPDSLGFLKSYILGCMSIGKAYEMVAKITPKFVKSCTFESTRLGPNKAKLVVRPRPGAQEKLYQCENRMGYFEATGTLFHHKLPQIEHTKCVLRGDECCEYVVTWRTFKYEMWKKNPEPRRGTPSYRGGSDVLSEPFGGSRGRGRGSRGIVGALLARVEPREKSSSTA